MANAGTTAHVAAEAQAILARLDQVRPLSVTMTMVPAAAVSMRALRAIDTHLRLRRRSLRGQLSGLLRWLSSPARAATSPVALQRVFVGMRLRVLAELTQLDIFADAVTQRSEQRHGIWLAGLDALAEDALRLPMLHQRWPAVLCYLDRGYGAAIRRAATRLPGGGRNPVAIVRVPRERMVGSGVASSIVHEVGHQVAALRNLLPDLQRHLASRLPTFPPPTAAALRMWSRWLSELFPDLWAVARLGIVATRGLVGVVSLPAGRVFHIRTDDPHPPPWLRVLASCAFGQAIYPHRQWQELAQVWSELYPLTSAPRTAQEVLARLLRALPTLVREMLAARPTGLEGLAMRDVLHDPQRRPTALERTFAAWGEAPRRMRLDAPTLAIAVLGHAAQSGLLRVADESRIVTTLLQRWAIDRADGSHEASPCPRHLADHAETLASAGVATNFPISA